MKKALARIGPLFLGAFFIWTGLGDAMQLTLKIEHKEISKDSNARRDSYHLKGRELTFHHEQSGYNHGRPNEEQARTLKVAVTPEAASKIEAYVKAHHWLGGKTEQILPDIDQGGVQFFLDADLTVGSRRTSRHYIQGPYKLVSEHALWKDLSGLQDLLNESIPPKN